MVGLVNHEDLFKNEEEDEDLEDKINLEELQYNWWFKIIDN